MVFRRIVTAILLSGVLGSLALAQHSDIELFDNGGRVATEPRIAEGEFGELPNPAYRADEPGLESDSDELLLHGKVPLPGGALVGFDLAAFSLSGATKSLFYWDGGGSPDFVSLSSPHQLKISDATETFSVQFDGSSPVTGLNFALTADGGGLDPAGFLHSHLKFDLVEPTGIGVDSPTAGVYAFATTFRVDGLTNSEPVYWVLASGVDEAIHEAAFHYISGSAGLVPEPVSLLLATGSLVSGLVCRNRRSAIEQRPTSTRC